jgi:hypothetical protein
MAIARKVVVVDFNNLSADYVWARGVLVLALGITCWLLHKKTTTDAAGLSPLPNHRHGLDSASRILMHQQRRVMAHGAPSPRSAAADQALRG